MPIGQSTNLFGLCIDLHWSHLPTMNFKKWPSMPNNLNWLSIRTKCTGCLTAPRLSHVRLRWITVDYFLSYSPPLNSIGRLHWAIPSRLMSNSLPYFKIVPTIRTSLAANATTSLQYQAHDVFWQSISAIGTQVISPCHQALEEN